MCEKDHKSMMLRNRTSSRTPPSARRVFDKVVKKPVMANAVSKENKEDEQGPSKGSEERKFLLRFSEDTKKKFCEALMLTKDRKLLKFSELPLNKKVLITSIMGRKTVEKLFYGGISNELTKSENKSSGKEGVTPSADRQNFNFTRMYTKACAAAANCNSIDEINNVVIKNWANLPYVEVVAGWYKNHKDRFPLLKDSDLLLDCILTCLGEKKQLPLSVIFHITNCTLRPDEIGKLMSVVNEEFEMADEVCYVHGHIHGSDGCRAVLFSVIAKLCETELHQDSFLSLEEDTHCCRICCGRVRHSIVGVKDVEGVFLNPTVDNFESVDL